MRRPQSRVVAILLAPSGVLALSVLAIGLSAYAAEEKPTAEKPAGEAEACCKAGDTTPPTELVAKFPKGQLHSPYPDYAKLAEGRPGPRQADSGCPAATNVMAAPAAAASARL